MVSEVFCGGSESLAIPSYELQSHTLPFQTPSKLDFIHQAA